MPLEIGLRKARRRVIDNGKISSFDKSNPSVKRGIKKKKREAKLIPIKPKVAKEEVLSFRMSPFLVPPTPFVRTFCMVSAGICIRYIIPIAAEYSPNIASEVKRAIKMLNR